MMPTPATVLTAHNLANALGHNTAQVIDALRNGRTGLKMHSFSSPVMAPWGAVAQLERLPKSLESYDTRQGRMIAQGVEPLLSHAARTSRRWGSQRFGIVLGSSTGGIAATEQAWHEFTATGTWPSAYDLYRHHAMQAGVELIQQMTGARGPAYVVSTACSSSVKAFASAQRLIAADLVDAVLVAGVDSLCQTTARGFAGLELVAPTACRPFSSGRQGISIGEGAAVAIVERRGEGAVSLLAVGESCDAYHMSAPHPEGTGAKGAMEMALKLGGVDAEQVTFINAHATGTMLNDAAEARAIKDVFGSSMPVVATKGYTGHMLGAAGATEIILSAIALEQGWIPASLGSAPLDPAMEIEVNLTQRSIHGGYALSNSFAFGGSNAVALLGLNP